MYLTEWIQFKLVIIVFFLVVVLEQFYNVKYKNMSRNINLIIAKKSY